MHKTGVFVDGASGQFSREKVGSIVDDYLANTGRLSSRHWERIMKVCGVFSDEFSPGLDVPVLREDRRNLYIRSSPIQVSDSD